MAYNNWGRVPKRGANGNEPQEQQPKGWKTGKYNVGWSLVGTKVSRRSQTPKN